MDKITMVQYGCGKMSAYTMRYAMEKGIEVIGAFDISKDIIGKDIADICGGEKTGVIVQDAKNFDAFLSEHVPDVAVVTTMSLFKDVYDALEICAKNSVNAITTCEEAFFPQNSNPVLFEKLDRLAEQNGCTLCGSGYQDVFWGNLISVLAGATHRIDKIVGKSSYNVEDYGIALAKAHGAGLTEEEFANEVAAADNISAEERQKLIQSGEFMPSYMWNVNGWLANKLGLTVKTQTQKCVPHYAKEDIFSSTLNMTIKKGGITGMSAIVTTETEEGVTLESECIGKVYDKTEFDCNDWKIIGEPNTEVTINRPNTVELTCATVINRIPELICAPAGFFTTEFMPENNYKYGPMEDYLPEDCDCGCGCNHEDGEHGCHCHDHK